ncbi:hypothetical protein L6164_027399 [Bauhinia variegata]|uniref:Uncharacterized protein n=1 Tax=Bauhinia variegata TaxID=167791 RepID=A0ACB9LTD8_BAUVA|nr:hypothetical protein L6164_027399 [Bauhinia variegata]
MRASLIRIGSVPVQELPVPGWPKVYLSRQASSSDKMCVNSPRITLHLHSNGRREVPARSTSRRVSEGDLIRSASENFGVHRMLNAVARRSFPATIRDLEYLSEQVNETWRRNSKSEANYAGLSPENGIEMEELGSASGGVGHGGDHVIPTITGGNDGDRIKIDAYYREVLKSNPTNALLLANYGKFLHEVEKDMVRAEEFYGRAILANPGDGELLSLYGKLIWERERDEDRAKSYFDQAVQASPDDCVVLGSYAHFMWEAEEEEEENGKAEVLATELIAAF